MELMLTREQAERSRLVSEHFNLATDTTVWQVANLCAESVNRKISDELQAVAVENVDSLGVVECNVEFVVVQRHCSNRPFYRCHSSNHSHFVLCTDIQQA